MRLRESFAIFMLTLMFSVVGCSKNYAGIYVDSNEENYVELRRDGTFFLSKGGLGVSGRYRVDGEVITLAIDGGLSFQGKIQGTVFVDSEGESWTRGEKPVRMSAKDVAVNRNQSNAASAVRTLNTAEETYRNFYHSYAGQLAILGPGATPINCSNEARVDSNHACLLDNELGCASTWCVKNSYRFNLASLSKVAPIGDYTTTATPVDTNEGGRNFCSNADAVVRAQTGLPLSRPVTAAECAAWAPVQ